jgi:hypothetical protein
MIIGPWDDRTRVFVGGVTVQSRPELSGTVVADELRPFVMTVEGVFSRTLSGYQVGDPLFSGAFQDRVVREEVTGTLTFYYRIAQLDGGLVQSVDVPMPGHVLVDVDFRLDDLGRVGPDSVSRSFGGTVNDPGVAHLAPEMLSFGFIPNCVTPADPSRFFFARTNETAFHDTGMTVTRSARLDPNDPDSPARAPGNAITAVGRISSTFLPY